MSYPVNRYKSKLDYIQQCLHARPPTGHEAGITPQQVNFLWLEFLEEIKAGHASREEWVNAYVADLRTFLQIWPNERYLRQAPPEQVLESFRRIFPDVSLPQWPIANSSAPSAGIVRAASSLPVRQLQTQVANLTLQDPDAVSWWRTDAAGVGGEQRNEDVVGGGHHAGIVGRGNGRVTSYNARRRGRGASRGDRYRVYGRGGQGPHQRTLHNPQPSSPASPPRQASDDVAASPPPSPSWQASPPPEFRGRRVQDQEASPPPDFRPPPVQASPPPDFRGRQASPPPDFRGRQASSPPDFRGRQASPPPDFRGRQASPPPDFRGRRVHIEEASPPPEFRGW